VTKSEVSKYLMWMSFSLKITFIMAYYPALSVNFFFKEQLTNNERYCFGPSRSTESELKLRLGRFVRDARDAILSPYVNGYS